MLAVAREEHIPDDRDTIVQGDPVLLVIEDDPHHARILQGLARDRGFKVIVATRGATGLSLARQFHPDAISLDIYLPDMLGWTVLSSLKFDPATRHIPVQIITMDEERQSALARGAFAYLVKAPTTDGIEAALDRLRDFTAPRTKRLLVVEDNDIERHLDRRAARPSRHRADGRRHRGRGHRRAARPDIRLRRTRPPLARHERLRAAREDPGGTGPARPARRRLHRQGAFPEDELRLKTMAKSIVLKDVQSPERLLDETALFLHRVVADLPDEKQKMLERLHGSNEILHGRKVLVVDDDARNIFALTTLLESHEIEVISATNGRQAIELIQSTPDLSMVLMDIMMPEMDGYQTMVEIRKDPQFRTLPMLALTAKAMKGDREKCLDAGASDYIAKPVNTEQLLSLMRVWLFR